MDNWGEGVVPACREERPQKFVIFLNSTIIRIDNFCIV